MPFITNLEKFNNYNKRCTYNCVNCGEHIKPNFVKHKNHIKFGFGSGVLCISCLFELHLELNDMFEQAPGKKSLMWTSLKGFTYPINRSNLPKGRENNGKTSKWRKQKASS